MGSKERDYIIPAGDYKPQAITAAANDVILSNGQASEVSTRGEVHGTAGQHAFAIARQEAYYYTDA